MSSSLPLPLPGPAATTGKKKKGGKKNVQGRTLTSAACNIPYGRSSVIFSGKSVAAAALSLSPFSLYRVEAGPDSGFLHEKGGMEGRDPLDAERGGKGVGEDDESREEC